MEQKIKNIVYAIFRKYGVEAGSNALLRQNRIINLCMNTLQCYPSLEEDLMGKDKDDEIRYFVIQTILNDILTIEAERI